MVGVKHVEQRQQLGELVPRDFVVFVGVEEFRQRFAEATTAAAAHAVAHGVEFAFVNEAVVVGVEAVEVLRRPRPLVFASYMATSASRMRSSALRLSPGRAIT